MKHKNSILFLSGNFITFLGNSLFSFLLSWWIIKETADCKLLGTILMVSTLPNIFFNLYFGNIVDTYNKKKLLIFSDIISGVVCILGYIILKDSFKLIILAVILLILNTNHILFSISSKSIITSILEQENISKFNSYQVFIKELCKFAGPLLGGILVMVAKPRLIILLNGISFILSGISEVFLDVNADIKKKKIRNFWEGFAYIKNESSIFWAVILASLVNFVLPGFNIFLPYISLKILRNDSLLPILLTIESTGVLLAPIILKILNKFKIKMSFYAAMIISGLALAINIFYFSTGMLIISVLVFSVFLTIFNILFFTYLQKNIPEHISGRVFGVVNSFALALTPLGNFVFGYIGEVLNKFSISIIGITIVIISIVIMKVNEICISKVKEVS